MSAYDGRGSFLNSKLSKPTSIFGLHLWVIIGILVGTTIVLVLFLLSLCLTSRRRNNHRKKPLCMADDDVTPAISKEIKEIPTINHHRPIFHALPEVQIDIGKEHHRVLFTGNAPSSGEIALRSSSVRGSEGSKGSDNTASYGAPEVSHLGWGRWYTLRELQVATNCLADENVIGEGGYGIVYRGVLQNNTMVAVKNLLNNSGEAEKEFEVEVEAIGRVRHKNLVRLHGYCVEGAYRMLVYEYVDNGNLDQWLHGDVGEVSPLTWDIRMNIILGTAKGLAYLHDCLEPKVVHRDIKSSNILLDHNWNPKVSDFGLAKLLCSEKKYVTTRVMGTFGYVAPEYASTGMLTEKSDVYSFGILIMEIISGRIPIDYSRPPGEVNLVGWLKTMVGNKRNEEVVDHKLLEVPASKPLKRVLLVALRCVDPDSHKRPKMSQVVHMLETDNLLFHDGRRLERDSSTSKRECAEEIEIEGKNVQEGSTDKTEA